MTNMALSKKFVLIDVCFFEINYLHAIGNYLKNSGGDFDETCVSYKQKKLARLL